MSAQNPFERGYSYQPPGFSPQTPGDPFGQGSPPGVSGPGNQQEPNTFLVLMFIALLAGVAILSCGGLGYVMVRRSQAPEIVKVQPAAPQPIPRPAAQRQRMTKSKTQPPNSSPPGPKIPPPSFTPPGFTPPSSVPPPEAPLTPFELRRPTQPARAPAASPKSGELKLTDLLQKLNDPQRTQPAVFPLIELERLPVRENRRAEVAKALEPHLNSTDISTLIHVTKVVPIWGAEVNMGSLSKLIDHENTLVRWQAIRALAKISPTAETAEKLAARIGEPADARALREAFQVLGEEGEIALLRRLDGGDVKTRWEAVALLGDTGTEVSRAVLAELAAADPDLNVKSRAQRALQQLEERKAK